MAASSKPTAIHFALVVFAAATVISLILFYRTLNGSRALEASASKFQDDVATAKNALSRANDEITSLKRLLGYDDLQSVGVEGDQNPGTVIGRVRRDLTELGREQVQPSLQAPTVAGTLQSMRAALNSAQGSAQSSQSNEQTLEAELAQEKAAHANRASELETSQQNSETQLQTLVGQKGELLSEKDREIGKWRDAFRTEQREKESLQDELTAVRKTKDTEITGLTNANDALRQRLNDLEDLSFDKPDGKIVRVDNTTRTVWIDLGADDNLRSQVGFSVYTKNHHGVGRGNADIKAKIEVSKIRGPHLAEGRILTEDADRPILAGDPIYTPVWSKGQKDYFSFVGIVDMDGDGKSDREVLHNLLETSGAGIELEINDQGDRVPAGATLTVKSKFLVIGEIDDPTAYPGFDEVKQAQIQKIHSEHAELNRLALRNGIRAVSFRDFLNYMGFEPQNRLYVSGEDRPFTMKFGGRKTLTDEVSRMRTTSKGQPTAQGRKKPASATESMSKLYTE